MSGAWRTTVVAVSLTATLTGCSLVSQPDATSWDDQATQALSDAAGQVGTARMALDSARRGRTWSSYTVVLVAQAEEAMGTTQDKVSTLQVPAGREKRAARIEQLLDDAGKAVQDARADAVTGRYDDPRLRRQLSDLGERLQKEAGR